MNDSERAGRIEERKQQIEAMRARHAAFMLDRLVSPAAREEWRANVRATWDELLEKRVGDLVSPETVADGIEAVLDRASVDGTLRPAAKAIVAAVAAEARRDQAAASTYVPAGVVADLDRLLERPKLIPEALVREVLDSDAAELVMRDVLFEALKEFSEKVNPVVAEWGLPALLKKLSPFGLGGIGKGLEAMRAELDKRTEPEIRKFLLGFSKRALREMGDFTVAKADTPPFVTLRKHVAHWLLSRPVAELAAPADEETARAVEDLVVDALAALVTHPVMRARRRALVEKAVRSRADHKLGDALQTLGITTIPDLDAITRATWEPVTAVLSTEVARVQFGRMLDEFYDRELARLEYDALAEAEGDGG
jgi:hypothetical protein